MLATLPVSSHRQLNRLMMQQHAVMPALRYIDEHLGEAMDNATLAAQCHLSEDHFIRRFRESVGQTPAQYVLDRRVSTAAQQLVFSSESIEAIADQTGFPNRFYFSRMFARRMGVPPAAYRNTSRV